MNDGVDLLKLYQDFGIDEIISEKPINRLNRKINLPAKNYSEIDNGTVANHNSLPATSATEVGFERSPIAKSVNIIVDNFANMTQAEAISELAKRQSSNYMDNRSPLVPTSQIISKVREIVSKIHNLSDLENAVRNFDGCSLKKMATNTVFCDGDPASKIMIIGEAPGNNEDLQGIPFCGDSGKLLGEMFAAIGLTRDKVYITNALFWRPPGNRRPTNDELGMCKPFVEKHIELIAPRLIVLMGATAMYSVLGIHDPISKIRGKILDYKNQYLSSPVKSISLFHPSYLMRQPSKKRLAWQDLLVIKKFLQG